MVDGVSAAVGLSLGLLVGYVGRRLSGSSCPAETAARQPHRVLISEQDDPDHCQLALVVRQDLKMGKGKVGAQCSHAALAACRQAERTAAAWLQQWRRHGQRTTVLRAAGELELFALERAARADGLPTALIQDAGRTQIAPGSVTVLGLGPAPAHRLQAAAGRQLPLL